MRLGGGRDLGHEADGRVVSVRQWIRHVVSNIMSNDGLSGRVQGGWSRSVDDGGVGGRV